MSRHRTCQNCSTAFIGPASYILCEKCGEAVGKPAPVDPRLAPALLEIRYAIQRGILSVGACEFEGKSCRGHVELRVEDYDNPIVGVRSLCDAHRDAKRAKGRMLAFAAGAK